jgi:molecular chaperone GrpE
MSNSGDSQSHELSPEEELPDFEEEISHDLDANSRQVVDELVDGQVNVDKRLADAERQVLLAQAELENFRQRMKRDTDQQLKYSNLPLVRDLLDVIDNLNRATGSADQARTQPDPARDQALLDGVRMVVRQFESVLSKYGCKPIQAVGQPFDPNFHEAISQMPSPEHAAGTVAHEVAVGYTLHDRVVRPSSVIVSTGG